MGWFSNRCEAYIDPKTGKALTGQELAVQELAGKNLEKELAGKELEKARQTRGWPRCGYRVSKKAVFCSKCGAGAPGGWFRCAACGKWIGNDSNCCPYCGTPLHPDTRADFGGGIWAKKADLFAQRFEVGDVARLLKVEQLQVQEGTLALLLDAGKYAGTLKAGRHNPDSLARTVNWFGNPPPRSLIMVDAGDVRLPLEITGLRTAEKIPVDFTGDIVLRFDPGHADEFIANAFKTHSEFSYDALIELLAGGIRSAVADYCIKTNMSDLAFDPARRQRLVDELQEALKVQCPSLGLEIRYVATADFQGAEYEQLVEQEGALALKRREIEFTQASRELLGRDRMHEFKTETDLKSHLAALAHEYKISDLHRQREEKLLLRGWAHQDEIGELQHKFDVEKRELEHGLAIERERRNSEIDEAVHQSKIRAIEVESAAQVKVTTAEADARVKVTTTEADARVKVTTTEAEAKAAKLRADAEAYATREALKLKEEKYRIKGDKKDRDVKRFQGLSIQEQVAHIEDAEIRSDLLEVLRLSAAQQMTPEQMLALAAAKSPAAAEALAAMAVSKQAQDRELMAKREADLEKMREHDEKMARIFVEPASKAADRKGEGSTNIVK